MNPAHLGIDIKVVAIISVEWVIDLEPSPTLSGLIIREVSSDPGSDLFWRYSDLNHSFPRYLTRVREYVIVLA